MRLIDSSGVEVTVTRNADGSIPTGPASGGGGSQPGVNVGVVVAVLDNTGEQVAIDSLAQTLTYNGPNGAVDTIAATNGSNTWTQTFTYTDSNITGISQWVRS